jgi:hypothetical protein
VIFGSESYGTHVHIIMSDGSGSLPVTLVSNTAMVICLSFLPHFGSCVSVAPT